MARTEYMAIGTPVERAVTELRTTVAIRERAGQLLARARRGESRWFVVEDNAMQAACDAVTSATRKRYPKLDIPFHSRWRHFEAGGVDRRGELEALLPDRPAALRAHALIDLAFVSVLLDAGAGPDWKYVEPGTGQSFTRSEGLAVASFHAFKSGLFSSDKARPLQADMEGLRHLSTARLAEAFQVSETNPLVGLEGRAILLRQLGEAIMEEPGVYGDSPGRPGGLFDVRVTPFGGDVPPTADVSAHDLLSHILMTLSGIWPANNTLGGAPLGDCWRHEAVRGEGLSDGWIPFHKLSQWLTYSLIEPFFWSGVRVRGLQHLTALPEYRNGGLLLDSGWLRLRDESVTQTTWQPGDELIVEWRALTVALLDELAHGVRKDLRLSESALPLACVLEGGTWAAGRELAQQRRNGLPPLQVASDGTVF